MQSFGLIAEISRQCLDFESKLTIPQIRLEFSCRPWNNWSLSSLAEKCGLSERSFERQFRKLCGCSWLQYLTGAKIGFACILLQTTLYSVDEIIQLCNFRSKPYFFTAFKKQTGTTPLAFRWPSAAAVRKPRISRSLPWSIKPKRKHCHPAARRFSGSSCRIPALRFPGWPPFFPFSVRPSRNICPG